jgi:hypothetical protein
VVDEHQSFWPVLGHLRVCEEALLSSES